jgi:hypothetical protein
VVSANDRGTVVHPAATLSGIDPERLRVAYEAEAAFDFQRSHVGRPETETTGYRLRRPVANLVKGSARRWGTLTSSRRAAPDFLLIGAKRAGSTTLYRGLVDSGGIAPMFPAREQRKGVYYFDVHHALGDRWYLGHMPLARTVGDQRVGEASPYYLSHPHAAARAAALIPEARIVVVLRDPIERAHSHYRERWKQGVEYLPTFDEAVAAEPGRLDGELEAMLENPRYVGWNHLNFGYLEQSRYATNLGRWYDAYPSDQILVLRAEDLYADPGNVIDEVREFIGLPAAGNVDVAHHNKLEPGRFSAETATRLRDALAPEVRRLEELVGRPMGWPTG